MKIVTGRRGEDHVTSNDFQAFNQGLLGSGNYILNVGNKFAATMTSPTEMQILDGEGVMQGVHFRVIPGLMDTVELSPGVMGVNRIDLVCARYTKNTTTGVESVDWHVVEGTPNAGNPVAPEATSGNILQGDDIADFPIFKVTYTGLTPAIEKMYIFAVGETKTYSEVLTGIQSSEKRFSIDLGNSGLFYVDISVGNDSKSRLNYEMELTPISVLPSGYQGNISIFASGSDTIGGNYRGCLRIESDSKKYIYVRVNTSAVSVAAQRAGIGAVVTRLA